MMSLAGHLQAHAARQPDKIFWRQLSGGRASETTFRQLHARASSFARAYRAAGLGGAQPVLIFLPHGVEAVAAFMGAMLAGAMPSFMPCPSAKQHPSVYWPAHLALLQRLGPHVLVSDRHHVGQMAEHGLATTATAMIAAEDVPDSAEPYPLAQTGPESVALLQHSSGTTALKKSVALTHRVIQRQVELYAARLQTRPGDTIVSWLPLYHDMGLIACMVMPLILGQTVTSLDPFEWAARPVSLFEAIARHGGDFVWMPNFGFEHLVRTVRDDFAADLSGVRAFINCSEPCRAETFDRFQRRFASLGVRPEQLQVCYAMAETVFAVTQTAMGEPVASVEVDSLRLRRDRVAADPEPGSASDRVLSTGRPLPGLDVRIRDGGRDLGDNQVGEVVLRGDIVFGGYLNDPEATGERLSNGFYHTRDLGFTRAGELYILGRKDDLIIVNGRNLHAHEVEAVAARVPGLKPGRTVAFGVLNDETGSEELVLVAERDGLGDTRDGEIGRALRAAIYDETNIEVKTFRIVDPGWLVKTTSGKISREANRTKYLSGDTVAEHAAGRADRVETQAARLASFIANHFRCPPEAIGRRTEATDVPGWDSLAHATLILAVEREFNVRFADREIFTFRSVGDLADRIDELLAAGGGGDRQQPEDRHVHKSDAATIVRLGLSDGPDIVVFAGREMSFGGLGLMDFASIFAQTEAADSTKYFVTDHAQSWYTGCFEEVAAKLNALSDKPKIIFGNSMGGYGALRFAQALRNTIGVMAFVPQMRVPRGLARKLGRPPAFWDVHLVPGVQYCVLYGEAEDEPAKEYFRRQIHDPARQHMIVVPNCGHNLATYLNEQKLLTRVVECCRQPDSMAREVQAIVATIEPAPEALRERAEQLARQRTRTASQARAAGSPSVTAQAPTQGGSAGKPAPLHRRFAAANLTGDGRLTIEQAKVALPYVARNFDGIDAARKGYVTLEEVRAFLRRAQGRS